MSHKIIAFSSYKKIKKQNHYGKFSIKRKVTFNFEDNSIEVMTLDTLRRTREENDPAGNPVRGIYHYMVIQRILDICEKYKLNHEIEEILLHKTKQKSTGCCDRPPP